MAIQFFHNLYSQDEEVEVDLALKICFPCINPYDVNSLSKPYDKEEIHEALR